MHQADLYEQSNALQKRDALACLEKLAPKMKWKKKNNIIIDVGCGDGSVTNLIKKYLPTDFTLIGADISENMVKFASEHHFDEQTSFIVLDIADDLPEVLKENFDHVFSNYSLHWVIDQKRAFENIFNLLNQNGNCLLIILAYHTVFEVYRAMSRSSKWNTWVKDIDKYISPYHDSEEPDKEVTKIMEDIGFDNIDVKCEDKIYQYDDINILKKHKMAINPFPIPKNKEDDYIDDYIQILKDIEMKHTTFNNNNSKGVTVYYKLLTVYGSKPSNISVKH